MNAVSARAVAHARHQQAPRRLLGALMIAFIALALMGVALMLATAQGVPLHDPAELLAPFRWGPGTDRVEPA